jgi:hypothetical protein
MFGTTRSVMPDVTASAYGPHRVETDTSTETVRFGKVALRNYGGQLSCVDDLSHRAEHARTAMNALHSIR